MTTASAPAPRERSFRTLVQIGTSLDGYIARPDGDCRATARADNPSPRCSRRISAQSSTPITSSLPTPVPVKSG
ncbi:hypothetical protein [Streptomyces sp. LS1784]|uniref:hypothetical protein n=1 Tax=Streptomyces sp. LS1784 TaxID=2851533 RepID=UPI001CCBE208|nr:hypothetical protein [Streptomyces sp. LS1784]